MINLHVLILLLAGMALAVVNAEVPDCENCTYSGGVGFVQSRVYCSLYYMCFKSLPSSSNYGWTRMCCAEGLRMDEEHMSCTWDRRAPGACVENRMYCRPTESTTNIPCPFKAHATDRTLYVSTHTGHVMQCANGGGWSERACTCGYGNNVVVCDKLLSYEFEDSYDSDSCNNFATGEPVYDPSLVNGALYVDGGDQYLALAYLSNWFAWNPVAATFSFCFWFRPESDAQSAGLFSTNCHYNDDGSSVGEIYLVNGNLMALLGTETCDLLVAPTSQVFHKVCVTFERGQYVVYYDGQQVKEVLGSAMPVNSQSSAALGTVNDMASFEGHMDDFCFYKSVLSATEVKECYDTGPSNAI